MKQRPRVSPSRRRGARAPRTRPAVELEEITRALPGFTIEELREIPVLRAGSRLVPGAAYLDLSKPIRNGA